MPALLHDGNLLQNLVLSGTQLFCNRSVLRLWYGSLFEVAHSIHLGVLALYGLDRLHEIANLLSTVQTEYMSNNLPPVSQSPHLYTT